jgi:hypothetical protein
MLRLLGAWSAEIEGTIGPKAQLVQDYSPGDSLRDSEAMRNAMKAIPSYLRPQLTGIGTEWYGGGPSRTCWRRVGVAPAFSMRRRPFRSRFVSRPSDAYMFPLETEVAFSQRRPWTSIVSERGYQLILHIHRAAADKAIRQRGLKVFDCYPGDKFYHN